MPTQGIGYIWGLGEGGTFLFKLNGTFHTLGICDQ